MFPIEPSHSAPKIMQKNVRHVLQKAFNWTPNFHIKILDIGIKTLSKITPAHGNANVYYPQNRQ